MIKKSILLAVFLSIAMLLCTSGITYATIAATQAKKTLYIIESHSAGQSSVVWRDSDNIKVRGKQPTFTLGSAGLTQTTFPNATTALTTVRNAVSPHLNAYVAAVARHLSSDRYSYARVDWFFNFTDAGDDYVAKRVYLPLMIYPDGRVRNLGWRVISAEPRILYYIYRSLRTDNLPQEWAFPDGGMLTKHVLDQNFNIISSSTVNTHGRFDPPIIPEGDSVTNPNAGVELLIREIVLPDIKNRNALYAIVDYHRPVSPAWDCDAQGNCIARVSVETLERRFSPHHAGGCYSIRGRIGWELQFQAERWFVEPSGNFRLTAISTGRSVSPTQEFAKTTNSSNPPWDVIIDPFETFNMFSIHNDTVNGLPCDRYIHGGHRCNLPPITTCVPNVINLTGDGSTCGWVNIIGRGDHIEFDNRQTQTWCDFGCQAPCLVSDDGVCLQWGDWHQHCCETHTWGNFWTINTPGISVTGHIPYHFWGGSWVQTSGGTMWGGNCSGYGHLCAIHGSLNFSGATLSGSGGFHKSVCMRIWGAGNTLNFHTWGHYGATTYSVTLHPTATQHCVQGNHFLQC